MEFSRVERDFVERTLALLEQYDEYVVPKIGRDERYEVSLLLNCLLGLIILPFEYSGREQKERERVECVYPQVVPDDLRFVAELGPSWGLADLQVKRLKIWGKTKPVNEITLCDTIALMRHSMAHARFEDGNKRKKPQGLSVSYNVFPDNPIESLILQVNFVNEHGGTEFEATIPVKGLRNFSSMVAKQFLARLDQKQLTQQ